MKSKPFTYLLLIIVAVIYYNVFFRIKSNLMGEETILSPNTSQTAILKSQIRDTFPLNANYRDPFEGIVEKPTPSINLAPNVVQPVVRTPPPPPRPHQWPKVKYYGLMKKSTSKKPLCMVNIDDMLFDLREGDYILDGYMIKGIYRDSIVIQYKKIRKTFYK